MYTQFKMYSFDPELSNSNFTPHFKQKLWLDCVDNNYNIIARRTRQIGYTTLHVMSALKLALTNTNFSIGLCEKSNSGAIEALRRIVWVFENSRIDTNVTIISKRQHELIFSNGSTIRIISHDGYRGQHFDMIYFDVRTKNEVDRTLEALSIFKRWTIGYHYNYQYADIPHRPSTHTQSLKEYRKTISDLVKSGAQLIDFSWSDYPRDDVWKSTVIKNFGGNSNTFTHEFELPTLHA